MKRIDRPFAGRPKSDCARRDVAGMPASPQWAEVASFQHAMDQSLPHRYDAVSVALGRALDDPAAAFAEDAMLLKDFAEFLDGDGEAGTEGSKTVLQADVDFRERLRGRLWRTFVQTHLRDGGRSH